MAGPDLGKDLSQFQEIIQTGEVGIIIPAEVHGIQVEIILGEIPKETIGETIKIEDMEIIFPEETRFGEPQIEEVITTEGTTSETIYTVVIIEITTTKKISTEIT